MSAKKNTVMPLKFTVEHLRFKAEKSNFISSNNKKSTELHEVALDILINTAKGWSINPILDYRLILVI